MSTQKIYNETIEIIKSIRPNLSGSHLDIGSGSGSLIRMIKNEFRLISKACDYTGKLMKVNGQKVDIVDLNTQSLPYNDNEFDIVTCTEVLEHLENHRETLREIYRVTKEDGVAIFTTPNILNIKSRLRFLFFGFWNLFGPLHVKESNLYSTGGHINPISYFYIAHSLFDAGFSKVEVTVDKYQRSSIVPYIFLILPIKIFGRMAYKKEVKKYKTIDDNNSEFVEAMNSKNILLGRTIITTAYK